MCSQLLIHHILISPQRLPKFQKRVKEDSKKVSYIYGGRYGKHTCLLAGFEFWKIQEHLKLLSSDVHMVQREVVMHYLSIGWV